MKNSPRQPKCCVIQKSGTLRNARPTILPERVDGVGARTLVLREPGGEDAAVGRKARGFEDADADARQHQPVASDRTTPMRPVKIDQNTTATK